MDHYFNYLLFPLRGLIFGEYNVEGLNVVFYISAAFAFMFVCWIILRLIERVT